MKRKTQFRISGSSLTVRTLLRTLLSMPRMSTTSAPPGALRRDAQRNLELVVAAADRVFAARGLGATLADVAAGAGVGVGTIYRRFPTKEALVQAVFDHQIQTGAELVAECLQFSSARHGLDTLLRRGLELQGGNRGLHEFMYKPELLSGRLVEIQARVEPLIAELVNRAKTEGALRHDFHVNDLSLIVLMLSRLAHTSPTLGPNLARRYLELLLKGLDPTPDAGPVPPCLDDHAYARWVDSLIPHRNSRS